MLVLFASCRTDHKVKVVTAGFEKSGIQVELDSIKHKVLLIVEELDSNELRKFNLYFENGKISTILKTKSETIDSKLIKPNRSLHKVYSSSDNKNHDVITIEIRDDNILETFFVDQEGRINFLSSNNSPHFEYNNTNGKENLFENYEQNNLIQLILKKEKLSAAYKLIIQTEDGCISYLTSSNHLLDENGFLKEEYFILDLNNTYPIIELINLEICDTTLSFKTTLTIAKNNRFIKETPLNLFK